MVESPVDIAPEPKPKKELNRRQKLQRRAVPLAAAVTLGAGAILHQVTTPDRTVSSITASTSTPESSSESKELEEALKNAPKELKERLKIDGIIAVLPTTVVTDGEVRVRTSPRIEQIDELNASNISREYDGEEIELNFPIELPDESGLNGTWLAGLVKTKEGKNIWVFVSRSAGTEGHLKYPEFEGADKMPVSTSFKIIGFNNQSGIIAEGNLKNSQQTAVIGLAKVIEK